MAVIYLRKKDGKLEEIGRTEVILNNLNPKWIEKITVSFQFEAVQTLVFQVYDIDTRYHNVPVKTLKLKDQDYLGEATCVLSESNVAVPICRTEVVDNNFNPMWKPVCLTMQQFGSKENPLVIECIDFNSNGNHELIGKTEKL